MWRKIVGTLVILGWISLSCFDVVEDLNEIPDQAAVFKSFPEGNASTKRGAWGPLANNIVESAIYTKQDYIALLTFIPTIIDSESFLDFHAYFPLHKLHRVFLI